MGLEKAPNESDAEFRKRTNKEYQRLELQRRIQVKDYKDVPSVKVTWLWEPFIPFGDVTIVEGDGMTGKTTALIRLACMCSRGIVPPALKNGELQVDKDLHTDPFHILYIGVEANNETEIRPSIEYGQGDINYFHFIDQSEKPFVLNPGFIEEAVRQSQCRMIIVDPYTNFLPNNASLNNAVSMRALMTRLMNVARKTGVAIVLIGHLNKSPYGKAIYAGYGSGDIINTVRSVLLVNRDENGINYLRVLKSNYFGVDAFYRVALLMDDNYCVHFEDYNYVKQKYAEERKEISDIDELENAPEEVKKKLSRTTQCAMEITDILSEGPVTRAEVYEKLGAEGYSQRTIARAFSNINGESYYEGRTVYWKLRDDVHI